ncbi:hypothetical protein [uncultured Aquimarina sp.]|uniref:hypothetical protein n=1 Tax=uncultured Aquimarina sp. TaxID=575652 RepID=UPI002605E11B|nr:hypothetical protein [uncultured Aquimarina sp.]
MDITKESPITGSFQFEKNKYHINENIWIHFRMENKFKKPIYVFFQKEIPADIRVEIRQSGEYQLNIDESDIGVSFIPEYPLILGEELSAKYLLNDLVTFEKEGIYTITLSMDIEYNSISIRSNQSKGINKVRTITSTISLEIKK